MNTLKPEARGRTNADIAEIRHLYLDLDEGGDARLQRLLESASLPRPSYVLDTSPGKHQAIWKVEGFTPELAEVAPHRMVAAFGGDPAATDAARVLRLPGFHGKKLAVPAAVRGYHLSDAMHSRQDFSALSAVPSAERLMARPESTGPRRDGHPLSQSERDWARVRDRLRAGAPYEQVQKALATSRQDKPNPVAYAERTVSRAIRCLPSGGRPAQKANNAVEYGGCSVKSR